MGNQHNYIKTLPPHENPVCAGAKGAERAPPRPAVPMRIRRVSLGLLGDGLVGSMPGHRTPPPG